MLTYTRPRAAGLALLGSKQHPYPSKAYGLTKSSAFRFNRWPLHPRAEDDPVLGLTFDGLGHVYLELGERQSFIAL